MKKKTEQNDQTGQTQKPAEAIGPAIDETVRTNQTGAWTQGDQSEYAPTAHTANKLTKMVLDPMTGVDSEAYRSDGAVKATSSETFVPVQKGEWDYSQPVRT